MLNLQFRLGMRHRYGPAFEKVREAYLRFILSCPIAVRMPEGIFISHSIPAKTDSRGFDVTLFDREVEIGDFIEGGPGFDLVWGRDYRPQNADAFAKLVGARGAHQRPRAVFRRVRDSERPTDYYRLLRGRGLLPASADERTARSGRGPRRE